MNPEPNPSASRPSKVPPTGDTNTVGGGITIEDGRTLSREFIDPVARAKELLRTGDFPKGDQIPKYFEQIAREGWTGTAEDRAVYYAIIEHLKDKQGKQLLFNALADALPVSSFRWRSPHEISAIGPASDLIQLIGWNDLRRTGTRPLFARMMALSTSLLMVESRRSSLLRQEQDPSSIRSLLAGNERLRSAQESCSSIVLRQTDTLIRSQVNDSVGESAYLMHLGVASSPSSRTLGERLVHLGKLRSATWFALWLGMELISPARTADFIGIRTAPMLFTKAVTAYAQGVRSSDNPLFVCARLLAPRLAPELLGFASGLSAETTDGSITALDDPHNKLLAFWRLVAESLEIEGKDCFQETHQYRAQWHNTPAQLRETLGQAAVSEILFLSNQRSLGRLNLDQLQGLRELLHATSAVALSLCHGEIVASQLEKAARSFLSGNMLAQRLNTVAQQIRAKS